MDRSLESDKAKREQYQRGEFGNVQPGIDAASKEDVERLEHIHGKQSGAV